MNPTFIFPIIKFLIIFPFVAAVSNQNHCNNRKQHVLFLSLHAILQSRTIVICLILCHFFVCLLLSFSLFYGYFVGNRSETFCLFPLIVPAGRSIVLFLEATMVKIYLIKHDYSQMNGYNYDQCMLSCSFSYWIFETNIIYNCFDMFKDSVTKAMKFI